MPNCGALSQTAVCFGYYGTHLEHRVLLMWNLIYRAFLRGTASMSSLCFIASVIERACLEPQKRRHRAGWRNTSSFPSSRVGGYATNFVTASKMLSRLSAQDFFGTQK